MKELDRYSFFLLFTIKDENKDYNENYDFFQKHLHFIHLQSLLSNISGIKVECYNIIKNKSLFKIMINMIVMIIRVLFSAFDNWTLMN